MEKKATQKGKQTVTEIEKNLGNILSKLKSIEKNKEELEGIKIENASEILIGESKRCYLIHVSGSSDKNIKKAHSLLVKAFEDHYSTPVVIIPCRNKINGNLFRKYRGTKVPRNLTLTAVFDSYLDDVLYPATMVGKRIRYPKGKVRQYKAFVDSLDKETIEYKVAAITSCYRSLTNRELQIEFPESK